MTDLPQGVAEALLKALGVDVEAFVAIVAKIISDSNIRLPFPGVPPFVPDIATSSVSKNELNSVVDDEEESEETTSSLRRLEAMDAPNRMPLTSKFGAQIAYLNSLD